MAWKILSALAALCLAGSAFFAWKNQERLKNERAREEYTKKNLTSIQEHKKAAEEAKVKHTAELAESTKELEKYKTDSVEMAAKAQEKEQELTQVRTSLEGVTKVVTELKKKIEEYGDIQKLMANIKDLENKKKEAEGALANQTQRLASAQENVKNLTESVKTAEEREARGRKGIVEPDFSARVSQPFNEWGFVVLSKGNGGGVFANADLEVKRGKTVVGKLRVRNVEQATSVADIIPGSVAEGERIRSGDLVVASAVPAKAPAAAATATGTTPAAGAPTTPAAPPAAASDPFGGMAPAAPAANSDPFGAAPAPAAAPAAPAAASDPFGAAPAPAAPAAGGAGTPQSPSTADPFGAAPPAKP